MKVVLIIVLVVFIICNLCGLGLHHFEQSGKGIKNFAFWGYTVWDLLCGSAYLVKYIIKFFKK